MNLNWTRNLFNIHSKLTRVKDVQSHGGTVLEFLGDGMLAVFGAPNDITDHPAQAVRCLQTMAHTMVRVNKTLSGGIKTGDASLTKKSSLPSKLSFRGGLHTGMVIAGNLGSVTQMKYAVVGDTVVSMKCCTYCLELLVHYI